MKFRNLIIIILLFFFINACSKQEKAEKPVMLARTAPVSEEKVQENQAKSEQANLDKEAEYRDKLSYELAEKQEKNGVKKSAHVKDDIPFAGHFYVPMNYENERKLEYTLSIAYESDDFHRSRLILLDTVAKYGFLLESRTTAHVYPVLSARIKIRTQHLYQALKEFERLGTLTSENISASDFTEAIMIENKKYERVQERLKRKLEAIQKSEKTYYDWESKENDLIGHEDEIDALAMQEWRFEDKLTWTTVHIELKGPKLPEQAQPVAVPDFKNAVNHFIKVFLFLGYGLLWALPYILGLAIVLILWRKIKSFRKKG